jgi:hypothetical protein
MFLLEGPESKFSKALREARSEHREAVKRFKEHPSTLNLREMGRTSLVVTSMLDKGRLYA